MTLRRPTILAVLLFVLASCSTGVDEPALDNPNDPDAEGALPAPEAITVALGDNQVVLAWSMPADAPAAARYAVYRRTLGAPAGDQDAEERFLVAVAGPTHRDRTVRNGHTYAYRIAAAEASGGFGKRSAEVTATPALFSIALAGNLPRTGAQQVNVQLNAPAGTEAVLLSENADFAGSNPVRYATSTTWTLGFGDGEKTLHAKFRLADGAESIPVSDSVILDTRAIIRSVAFRGSSERSPGDLLQLVLDAGEPDGKATVDIEEIVTGLPLLDDGTQGDATAGDGVYERSWELPAGKRVTAGAVTGRFTDAVGNAAAPAVAGRTLSVEEPPDAVTLLDATTTRPPDAAAATPRWTRSTSRDFDAYRLLRAADPAVGADAELAAVSTSQSTTELSDGDVTEGETYYYRVVVRDRSGREAGSNVLEVTVPNLRPPAKIDLALPDGVGETSLGLRWARSADRDFAAYRVHRDTEPGVAGTDALVGEVTDPFSTFLFDEGLVENTVYYYRLIVADRGGLATAGQEITARTRNAPPPAVTMVGASDIDTTAATVTWTESDAHDFASYRLYRDRGPGVGTHSVLVAEIDERETVVHRDTGLAKNTTYYYRVFVVDDGAVPGPLATGSPGAPVVVRTRSN